MGVPAKLSSMHIVDAYSGATVPRANSRPSTRNVPPVANVRAKPALSFLYPSKWSQNDERAPQGNNAFYQHHHNVGLVQMFAMQQGGVYYAK